MQFIRQSARPSEKIDTAFQRRLRVAIKLRPENRYQARNDADFAFLQEDPRFTELLYPERDGSFG